MLAGIPARAAIALGRQLSNPSGLSGRLLAVAMRVVNRRPTRALIDALDIRADHFVLDIGCGDGSTLQAVGRAAWMCGIDASDTMLESARQRLKTEVADGRLSIRHGDMLDLPFGPNSFDRYIASNVLYFCRDVPRLIAECRRTARPGAKLGIYVTAAETMAKWRFAGGETHRHFSQSQLDQELEAAGITNAAYAVNPIALPAGAKGLVAIVDLDRDGPI